MSLYNQERPLDLSQVVGQEESVSQVRGMLTSGKIPNVSLMIGPRGTGKTTIARIMARAMNCEHPTENGPCNTCPSCKAMLSENSMDFIEMDGASNNKVEDVHSIIKGAGYVPQGKYRIYLIDEVHMLSTSAFNALLKLLEEPPAYCRFILCTTEEQKVPATILSRCRRFNFTKIDMGTISNYLGAICEKYQVPSEPAALSIIAKASDGCMRDALSILEPFFDKGQVRTENVSNMLGIASVDALLEICNGILSGDGKRAVMAFRSQRTLGRQVKVLLKGILDVLTDAICYLYSKDTEQIVGTDAYRESITEFCSPLSVERATELIGELSSLYADCASYGDDSVIEAKLISLCGSQSSLILALRRIAELENTCRCLEDALFNENNTSSVPTQPVTEPITGTLEQTPVLQETDVTVVGVFVDATDECPFVEENSVREEVLPGDVSSAETKVVGTISLSGLLGNPAQNVESDSDSETDSQSDCSPEKIGDVSTELPASDDFFSGWL